MSIRILIADDHEVVRRGLALLLKQEPGLEVIGEAKDGRDAVSLAIELQPDVVLIDWKMPRQDGLQCGLRDQRKRPHHALPDAVRGAARFGRF